MVFDFLIKQIILEPIQLCENIKFFLWFILYILERKCLYFPKPIIDDNFMVLKNELNFEEFEPKFFNLWISDVL